MNYSCVLILTVVFEILPSWDALKVSLFVCVRGFTCVETIETLFIIGVSETVRLAGYS